MAAAWDCADRLATFMAMMVVMCECAGWMLCLLACCCGGLCWFCVCYVWDGAGCCGFWLTAVWDCAGCLLCCDELG